MRDYPRREGAIGSARRCQNSSLQLHNSVQDGCHTSKRISRRCSRSFCRELSIRWCRDGPDALTASKPLAASLCASSESEDFVGATESGDGCDHIRWDEAHSCRSDMWCNLAISMCTAWRKVCIMHCLKRYRSHNCHSHPLSSRLSTALPMLALSYAANDIGFF